MPAQLKTIDPMTIDRQRQLLQEIVAEYDLETVIDALCEAYEWGAIAAYLANISFHAS